MSKNSCAAAESAAGAILRMARAELLLWERAELLLWERAELQFTILRKE